MRKKDTIGKGNIATGNTVTDYSERETDDSVINHENDELNSLFIQALNHEKEKKRVARKRKQDKLVFQFLIPMDFNMSNLTT